MWFFNSRLFFCQFPIMLDDHNHQINVTLCKFRGRFTAAYGSGNCFTLLEAATLIALSLMVLHRLATRALTTPVWRLIISEWLIPPPSTYIEHCASDPTFTFLGVVSSYQRRGIMCFEISWKLPTSTTYISSWVFDTFGGKREEIFRSSISL